MAKDQFSKWNAIKVKAKYNFTCAHCGATENIQAHDPTGKHKDWKVGVALCPDCHSKEHPDIPKQLFFTKLYQPTWPNISARALAREVGCHNRTIIRRARKLGILSGKPLSDIDKNRIISNLRLYNPSVPGFTIKEFANQLRVHPRTVRRWIKLGKIRAIVNHRPIYVTNEEYNRLIGGKRFILWDRQMQSSLGAFPTRRQAEDYGDEHLIKGWKETVEIRQEAAYRR